MSDPCGELTRRRQIQEAQVVLRAADRETPVPRDLDREAQLDPLSDTNGNFVGSNGPAASGADESNDNIDKKRQVRRERALRAQRQQAEEEAAVSEAEYETVGHCLFKTDSSDGSTIWYTEHCKLCVQDDESEYASDSSDEDRRLAKPVFVTKGDRETVAEKEKAELEAAQLKEDEQKRKEAREVCSAN